MSVPAEDMRRIDPTSSQKSRFSHQIHTFFYLKPKTGMFPVFLRQPVSRSHILIKTNPQYTIFELIKTSLSVVPFHFLPHLHLAGGRGLSANWSHDQNMAAWLEPAS